MPAESGSAGRSQAAITSMVATVWLASRPRAADRTDTRPRYDDPPAPFCQFCQYHPPAFLLAFWQSLSTFPWLSGSGNWAETGNDVRHPQRHVCPLRDRGLWVRLAPSGPPSRQRRGPRAKPVTRSASTLSRRLVQAPVQGRIRRVVNGEFLEVCDGALQSCQRECRRFESAHPLCGREPGVGVVGIARGPSRILACCVSWRGPPDTGVADRTVYGAGFLAGRQARQPPGPGCPQRTFHNCDDTTRMSRQGSNATRRWTGIRPTPRFRSVRRFVNPAREPRTTNRYGKMPGNANHNRLFSVSRARGSRAHGSCSDMDHACTGERFKTSRLTALFSLGRGFLADCVLVPGRRSCDARPPGRR